MALGVTEEQYAEVKSLMLAAGTVRLGRGRGGSLVLSSNADSTKSTVKKKANKAKKAREIAKKSGIDVKDVVSEAPKPENPVGHINAKPRRGAPFSVEGRDYEVADNTSDDVIIPFVNRPSMDRNEFIRELFAALNRFKLSYSGIRAHRQELERCTSENMPIHQGQLKGIIEQSNILLAPMGLKVEPLQGIVRR